jgi:hypothetical protein
MEILIKERFSRCWMSSTHPSQLYTAWTTYIVCGYRIHRNEDLQLSLCIYSNNRRLQALVTMNSLI